MFIGSAKRGIFQRLNNELNFRPLEVSQNRFTKIAAISLLYRLVLTAGSSELKITLHITYLWHQITHAYSQTALHLICYPDAIVLWPIRFRYHVHKKTEVHWWTLLSAICVQNGHGDLSPAVVDVEGNTIRQQTENIYYAQYTAHGTISIDASNFIIRCQCKYFRYSNRY